MITFITSVYGQPSEIQLNSLYSWKLAGVQVIVASKVNDPVALHNQFPNVSVITEVETEQDHGINGDSPVIPSMITKALELIKTPMVALINSDIILRTDFKGLIKKIVNKNGENIFMSCPRYDMTNYKLEMTPIAHDILWCLPKTLHQDQSGDIFISSYNNFQEMAKIMPPFFLGRMVWDNWIHVYFNLKKDTPCFNCMNLIPTAHFSHDYGHLTAPLKENLGVKRNYKLMKHSEAIYPHMENWPAPSI